MVRAERGVLVLRARDERLDRGEVREAVDGPRQAVDPGGDGAHAQLRAERVAEVAAVPREQRVRVALPERDEPREPPLDGARVEAAAAHGLSLIHIPSPRDVEESRMPSSA